MSAKVLASLVVFEKNTMEARLGGTWFVKVFRHHFGGRGFGVLIGQRWFLVGARAWLQEAPNGFWLQVVW